MCGEAFAPLSYIFNLSFGQPYVTQRTTANGKNDCRRRPTAAASDRVITANGKNDCRRRTVDGRFGRPTASQAQIFFQILSPDGIP